MSLFGKKNDPERKYDHTTRGKLRYTVYVSPMNDNYMNIIQRVYQYDEDDCGVQTGEFCFVPREDVEEALLKFMLTGSNQRYYDYELVPTPKGENATVGFDQVTLREYRDKVIDASKMRDLYNRFKGDCDVDMRRSLENKLAQLEKEENELYNKLIGALKTEADEVSE